MGTADASSPPAPTVTDLRAELEVLEQARGYFVDETLAAALALAARAADLGDDLLQRRAQLVQADMLVRKNDLVTAARIVWSVHEWAQTAGDRALLARSHRQLTSTFAYLGDTATSLEHAVLALESLGPDESPVVRSRYRTKLADTLAAAGSFSDACDRYAGIEHDLVAMRAYDELVHVLNNHAFTEYEAGDLTTAGLLADRMLAVSKDHEVTLNPMALDTIAAIEIAASRYPEAEQAALEAVDAIASGRYREADSLASHLLTLAKAQRLNGGLAAAEESLQRCLDTCAAANLWGVRARALEESAATAAARGDFARAYSLHVTFHAESEALSTAQSEASARMRQAIFETDEARAAAVHFREQAMRDPLTGLSNRRYLDEQVAAMLGDVANCPLTIALVDLDHFKAVNDTFSHEVGDVVLREVARLLDETVAGAEATDGAPGFAARVGGEEFALVLPGLDLDAGAAVAEAARERVRAYDWGQTLGGGRQTISAGVASGGAGQTLAGILRAADAALYDAKARGRDRVVQAVADDRADRRRYR